MKEFLRLFLSLNLFIYIFLIKDETFSIEKLIYCVQKTHSSLNEQLLDNLKQIFKSDEDVEK